MKKVLMCVSIFAVIALVALNLAYNNEQKPDVVYSMANQHIEWHYAGK